MDRPKSEASIPADVMAAVAGARLIGAPTSAKHDEWGLAGRAAIQIAQKIRARLVLADVSTRSLVTNPYATGSVAADIEGYSSGEGAVDRGELEALGRHYLVEQLDEAAAAGIEAEAWLATKPGIASLPLFLDRFPGIDVLVVPPLDHPSIRQRLLGDTIAGVRARLGDRRLIVVHPDGQLSVDQPPAERP